MNTYPLKPVLTDLCTYCNGYILLDSDWVDYEHHPMHAPCAARYDLQRQRADHYRKLGTKRSETVAPSDTPLTVKETIHLEFYLPDELPAHKFFDQVYDHINNLNPDLLVEDLHVAKLSRPTGDGDGKFTKGLTLHVHLSKPS
jgi:hypothetical protein